MPCVHLGIGADGAAAVSAGVGTELIEALGAHMLFVLLHVLLPVQVVPAVVAVEAISHGGGEIMPETCRENTTHCQTYTSTMTGCFLCTPDGDSVAFSIILMTMKSIIHLFKACTALYN